MFFRSAAASILACLLALAGNAQTLKHTTTKTDTIPVGAGSTVTITGAPVGSIKVRVIPGNDVQISADIEVQASNEADVAAASVLTTYITQESLGKLSIVSVGRDSRRKFTDAEKKLIKRLAAMPYRIDYTVGVPRYTNVEISGGAGDLEVSHLRGYVKVNFVECNAVIGLEGGDADVTIARGKLSVQLGLGNSGIRNTSLQVGTGDLGVSFPLKGSADIDASILRSGKIENSLPDLKPRDRKLPFTDRQIAGRKGVGGASVKLTVGDGTLTLDTPHFP